MSLATTSLPKTFATLKRWPIICQALRKVVRELNHEGGRLARLLREFKEDSRTYLLRFDRFVEELMEPSLYKLCGIELLEQPDQKLNANLTSFSRIFVILCKKNS